MKKNITSLLTIIYILTFTSCVQTIDKITDTNNTFEGPVIVKQHNYGGWYCPDNLNGFPPVDIANWKNVPVINDRMPTQKETRNESSLIFVDSIIYPNAKPLDLILPKLARFYNQSSKKEELIIVIQAIHIQNDSIVGFRYLNGGNGSSHLSEITFLKDQEINKIAPSKFVSFKIEINNTQDEIWKVLTEPESSKSLQSIFDKNNMLNSDWLNTTKVNYKYNSVAHKTAEYAANLFGNQYIQIDWETENNQYVEKFLLLENKQTNTTELQIVCGPYNKDYEQQKIILTAWAKEVKKLSEE